MKLFSFCIYGSNKKYYYGLKENYRLIQKHFPEFEMRVYVGNPYSKDLLDELDPNIKRIYTDAKEGITTVFRYLPILDSDIDILFVRDADSEVNERDVWCIREFLKNNDFNVHSIRDHYWHKSRLMAGTTGFKKSCFSLIRDTFKKQLDSIKHDKDLFYGGDEVFLDKHVHPLIKDTLMIHTNINAHINEHYFPIKFKNDNVNFVGNVVEYEGGKCYKFRYNNFNIRDQLVWLQRQNQFKLIVEVGKNIDIAKIPFGERTTLLDSLCIANFYLLRMKECMDVYKLFEHCEITDQVIHNSHCFWQIINHHGYSIIASSILSYEPKPKEIVYYYGQFPIDYRMLPQSNKIYRNVVYYNDMFHHKTIYDKCWEKIDCIYIINLEERKDRYIEVMTELCRMNAPLDRVYHYKAKKDATVAAAYIGATKNHLDVVKNMMDNGHKNCLFLEDDFVFTSTHDKNKANMTRFLERNYDFDICFLSSSKFYRKEMQDDLLMRSYQECTTSSGYILNHKTVQKVYDCVLEGYELLCKNGDSVAYCIDRYWAKLNKDNKMFIFRDKMGYQRPNYSNIKRTVAMYLD